MAARRKLTKGTPTPKDYARPEPRDKLLTDDEAAALRAQGKIVNLVEMRPGEDGGSYYTVRDPATIPEFVAKLREIDHEIDRLKDLLDPLSVGAANGDAEMLEEDDWTRKQIDRLTTSRDRIDRALKQMRRKAKDVPGLDLTDEEVERREMTFAQYERRKRRFIALMHDYCIRPPFLEPDKAARQIIEHNLMPPTPLYTGNPDLGAVKNWEMEHTARWWASTGNELVRRLIDDAKLPTPEGISTGMVTRMRNHQAAIRARDERDMVEGAGGVVRATNRARANGHLPHIQVFQE